LAVWRALPLLAAVKEGGGSVAHQCLRNSRGKSLEDNPQHRRVTSQRPDSRKNIFSVWV